MAIVKSSKNRVPDLAATCVRGRKGVAIVSRARSVREFYAESSLPCGSTLPCGGAASERTDRAGLIRRAAFTP